MVIGKPEPRRERPDVPEAGKIGAARAGNTDIVLAKTHLSRRFRWELVPPACSRRRWRWLRPEFGNQPQDLGEHVPRHGDLGHLESDVAAVADEPGADLDQLLPQAGQRPVLIGSGVASVRKKLPRL